MRVAITTILYADVVSGGRPTSAIEKSLREAIERLYGTKLTTSTGLAYTPRDLRRIEVIALDVPIADPTTGDRRHERRLRQK
jgi:hypothetical protein